MTDLDLDEEGNVGYVYKSLGVAVFLLRVAMRKLNTANYSTQASLKTTNDHLFKRLVTDFVMEVGDADTNACTAGAVLGAYLGYAAVPMIWQDGLRHGAFLKEKIEGLCQYLDVSKGDYEGRANPHTALDGGDGFLTTRTKKKRKL